MLSSTTSLQLLTEFYGIMLKFSSSQFSRCKIKIYYDDRIEGHTTLLRDEDAKYIIWIYKVDVTLGCVVDPDNVECYCNTDLCGTTIFEWDRIYRNSSVYDPESILAQYMEHQLQDTYKGKTLRDGVIPCYDTAKKMMVSSSNPDARCVFRQSSTCGAKGRDSYLIEDYKNISMGKVGEEFCWLNNKTDIMCVCHEEYCSSRYNTMMELWKRSDDYSHELYSTKCLQRKLKALDKADELAVAYLKHLEDHIPWDVLSTTTESTTSKLTTVGVSSQTESVSPEKKSVSTHDSSSWTNATQRVGASTIATTLMPVLYESVAHIRDNVVPAIIANVLGDIIVVSLIFIYCQLRTKYRS